MLYGILKYKIKIKKSLFISMLFEILSFGVSAQMMDLMGSMTIDGAVSAGSVKSVGMANQRLKNTQVMSDIQLNLVDIMTAYSGNYQKMREREITSRGVNVKFRSASDGLLEIFIRPLTPSLCQNLLTAQWNGVVYFRADSKKVTPQEVNSLSTSICQKAKIMSIFFK